MIKTPEDLSDEFKKDGDILKNKSNELKDLMSVAPDAIRTIDAYTEMLYYTADELKKFSRYDPKAQDFPDFKGSEYYSIQSIYGLNIPSKAEVFAMGTSVSGLITDATSSVMYKVSVYPGYENDYFKNIPTKFLQLKFTDELCSFLHTIKPELATTWRSAWGQLALERADSIKNAAANARTVVDEISWIPNSEHLKSLKWCALDDKEKPIRAVRYAWIRYGDILPESLKNDPSSDSNWKSFNGSYGSLQKYVHTTIFRIEDRQIVETALKAIEIALIGYLELGMERLTP